MEQIIAHRGASGYAPENTLAAMHKAIALSAQWIEFDVMLTSDEEVIVFHDDSLERVSDGQGSVVEHTYQELLKLDVGAWFAPEFSGERIPSLATMLMFIHDHPSLSANVELKATPGKENALVDAVRDIFQQYALKDSQQLLFSSGSARLLEYYRSVDSAASLGLVTEHITEAVLAQAKKLNCVSLSVYYEALSREHVKKTQQIGCKVLVYTVNDYKLAKQLMEYGVDGIFTDYPDLCKRT